MDGSMPGFLHRLPEFAQTHVHWAGMPSSCLTLCCPILHPQSFPVSGFFLISWLFASCGQSFEASASASVFPMNVQDWFPLGLTGLISFLSKELSRVFSSATIGKHQFFSAQLSLWSDFHIHTWFWTIHIRIHSSGRIPPLWSPLLRMGTGDDRSTFLRALPSWRTA